MVHDLQEQSAVIFDREREEKERLQAQVRGERCFRCGVHAVSTGFDETQLTVARCWTSKQSAQAPLGTSPSTGGGISGALRSRTNFPTGPGTVRPSPAPLRRPSFTFSLTAPPSVSQAPFAAGKFTPMRHCVAWTR